MATMKMTMKDGKSIPAFAADGKGKMAKGGKVVAKKYATGGKVAVAKKSMGGKMVAPKKGMGGKIKSGC